MTGEDPAMEGRSVRSRRSRVALRLAVLGATAVSLVGGLSAVSSGGVSGDIIGIVGGGIVGVLGFTAVGAIILDRRPGEPVGRICLGIGLAYGLAATLRYMALFVDGLEGTLPPFFAAVAVISSTLGSLGLLLSGPLLISRFPRRAAAAWQRRIEDLLILAVALIVTAGAARPGYLEFGDIEPVPNPLAVAWLPTDSAVVFNLTALVYAAAYVVTALGLINRYRVGGSVVRAQIRWFVAAIGVSLALLVLMVVTTGNETLNSIAWSAWILSLLLPLFAITIAVLRYRLYDIDRIISNAIGYGLVTLVLFTLFAVVNLALVSQVSPLVNNEGVAVAASTLLVAALFNPLRVRVQRRVDRRFHRAGYDAERMVADFAARLRDELDLPTLATDLADTTVQAVEPTSAVLWLRRG
jgi:hypothetical protein